MPDSFAPSEFGGKTNKLGIQPAVSPAGKAGHTPTEDERLSLYYRTLDETGNSPEDNAHWHGLLPAEDQRKAREDAGLFERGVDF